MDAIVELDIKQRLAKLGAEDRKSVSAYLLRLKHASDEGRKEIGRLMSEMDQGKKNRLSGLESKLNEG